MNKPIYNPKGKAKEYGEWAVNIYNGCNHGCVYCYAPNMLRKSKEQFHGSVEPRPGIVKAVKKQLEKDFAEGGALIHLCFTCDPYPADIDTTPTREIIKAIKDSGNHVQILTKGGMRAIRDFDLLDKNDSFGVSHTTFHNWESKKYEPYAALPEERLETIRLAHRLGIKTWVSCEPVYNMYHVFDLIVACGGIDLFKIGKMNHITLESLELPPINWGEFGRECERLCKEYGRNYYIKEDLRKEMEK